jgi:hypothetical protein
MVLSPNSGIYPMKPSIKVSLIAAAIATIGIGGITKMVSASSPNTSLVAIAQEKVESRESSSTFSRQADFGCVAAVLTAT